MQLFFCKISTAQGVYAWQRAEKSNYDKFAEKCTKSDMITNKGTLIFDNSGVVNIRKQEYQKIPLSGKTYGNAVIRIIRKYLF